MGTIHPHTSQLTLNLEPGLSAAHVSLRACVASGVYRIGLERVAGKVDEAPSKLSEKLSGGTGDRVRDVGCDLLERYLAKTGDHTPIYYLIDKYLSDPTARRELAVAKVTELLESLPGMLSAAGMTRKR